MILKVKGLHHKLNVNKLITINDDDIKTERHWKSQDYTRGAAEQQTNTQFARLAVNIGKESMLANWWLVKNFQI